MSHSVSRLSKVTAEAGSITAQGSCKKTVPLRRFTAGLRQGIVKLSAGAWGPALLRTASIGLTMLGLAAIGTSSVAQGLGAAQGTTAGALEANLLSVAGSAQRLLSQAGSTGDGALPKAEEAKPAEEPKPESPAQAPPNEPGLTADGKIVLNTASATLLDRLPSVGPKRAEQIVALRERLGRFRSLNDLLRIRGIGMRTLKKMLPMLVLDPPAATASSEAPAGK